MKAVSSVRVLISHFEGLVIQLLLSFAFFLSSFGRLINGGVLCCLSLYLERAM